MGTKDGSKGDEGVEESNTKHPQTIKEVEINFRSCDSGGGL